MTTIDGTEKTRREMVDGYYTTQLSVMMWNLKSTCDLYELNKANELATQQRINLEAQQRNNIETERRINMATQQRIKELKERYR